MFPRVVFSGSQSGLIRFSNLPFYQTANPSRSLWSALIRFPSVVWSGPPKWFGHVSKSGFLPFPRVLWSGFPDLDALISRFPRFSRVPRVAWSGLVGFPGAHFPESDSANARFMQIKPICSASKRRLTMQCTTMWCDGERIDFRASFGSYDLWSAPKLE